MVQSVISGLSQKAVYDRDKEWFSTTNEDAVIHPGRLAKEGAMGAAVGGLLGGGQLGVQEVRNRFAQTQTAN